ncbi:MAG: 30S ribosomal protein S8e [Candidatus Aenigmarchaeota archaeon]|nr:30S ribosomal protein S8e [Candidatus Aenigmarchaeota archaeon]
MAKWHGESGRKPTGGKIQMNRKKRKSEMGGFSVNPKIGAEKRIEKSSKGGGKKTTLVSLSFANVIDTKNKSVKKVKILDVITNPANPDLARRKIITKGAIVNTELGRAKITSRPSQHGIANAVLIENA